MDSDFENYEDDVIDYMIKEHEAADISMYKDDVYINWSGTAFKVLEDSLAGNAYVKCTCRDKFGVYVGYRPKIVLIS